MTSIYDLYGTDKELEKNGVWIEYPGGEMFKVARIGTNESAYGKLLRQKTKHLRRKIEADTLDVDVLGKIMMDVFVQTSLLDWKNVKEKDSDGKEKLIDFNKENALELMRRLPDLFDDLHTQAQSLSTFQKESVEKDSKN